MYSLCHQLVVLQVLLLQVVHLDSESTSTFLLVVLEAHTDQVESVDLMDLVESVDLMDLVESVAQVDHLADSCSTES